MNDLILTNPRKGIKSARIYKVNTVMGEMVMLSVQQLTPRMKLITESHNSITAAKSYYSKEYQSPKWFERAQWKEE